MVSQASTGASRQLKHDLLGAPAESLLVPGRREDRRDAVASLVHDSTDRRDLCVESRQASGVGRGEVRARRRTHRRQIPAVGSDGDSRVREHVGGPHQLVEPQRDDGRPIEPAVPAVPLGRRGQPVGVVNVSWYGAPSARPATLVAPASTRTRTRVVYGTGVSASGENISVRVPDQ